MCVVIVENKTMNLKMEQAGRVWREERERRNNYKIGRASCRERV